MTKLHAAQYSFADIVHESLGFDAGNPADKLILQLIDTHWVQRLRDVSQTANTKLVYMFSEHTRFGHSLGVAYLAKTLLDHLARQHGSCVEEYRSAICAAAILHDIGHLAPGSHVACKTWFPGEPDNHEELGLRIICQDEEIRSILQANDPGLLERVSRILREDESLPPWTWQLLSGGGWNVDRGNWCIVDSIMAGVHYGRYNISALLGALEIAPSGELALRENRLDAMMHFALSRHAMYSQIYHHRVLLSADALNVTIIERARDVLKEKGEAAWDIFFADDTMQRILHAGKSSELALEDIFMMREAWWRYHLLRWRNGRDEILADLSDRLLHRRLLKMQRVNGQDEKERTLRLASEKAQSLGFHPKYYVQEVSTIYMHARERRQSLKVLLDNGDLRDMVDSDPLYRELLANNQREKSWVLMPEEAKKGFV